MGKKLSQMTWAEVEKEMSIAGSPEKIAQLGQQVMELISSKIEATNKAELINVELMLKRVVAEIRLLQRMYDKRNRAKYKNT